MYDPSRPEQYQDQLNSEAIYHCYLQSKGPGQVAKFTPSKKVVITLLMSFEDFENVLDQIRQMVSVMRVHSLADDLTLTCNRMKL